MPVAEPAVLSRDDFDALFAALEARGYEVCGPVPRDGAIVYDTVRRAADLPVGWTDRQTGGRYELLRRDDQALFGYVVGPHSWKKYLHVPALTLWRAHRAGASFVVEPDESPPPPPRALLGVRPCEVAALGVLDRVLSAGGRADPAYAARRAAVCVLAVNCTSPGGTCFCASLDTGPRAQAGYDLALTELLEPEHRFLIETGSALGAEIVAALPCRPAGPDDLAAARGALEAARTRMGRTLDPEGLCELLYRHQEGPHWDELGRRCLTCTNCTQVCPTCFCTTVEDHTALDGATAERRRLWDSCFTLEFSYIHGGNVRTSAAARYRHWITHKLGTWHGQFGTSGCVGCGRCITWCPVGIDLTAEAQALRQTESRGR